MVAASFRSVKLTYGQSYRVGLYAMTGAFLVQFLAAVVRLSGFPFMFTVVTLLIALLNLGADTVAPDVPVEAPSPTVPNS